jgi:uncharacterized damage-inducible protein DinB
VERRHDAAISAIAIVSIAAWLRGPRRAQNPRATLPNMALKHMLLMEYDHEMATTRKLLDRVPHDKLAWMPHDKSMTLGGLALHIAGLPGWALYILERRELDVSEVPGNREQPASHAAIMSRFAETSATARKALDRSDAELMAPWLLKRGDQEIFSIPKSAALRSFVLSHLIHHRGQLSVYLRLNNVIVPAIYGPSADES